jgi:hypothetical protein
MTEIRANAVSVDKLFRGYQDANSERLAHLNQHIGALDMLAGDEPW